MEREDREMTFEEWVIETFGEEFLQETKKQYETLVQELQEDCLSCGGENEEICPNSAKVCGHHCNHSWTHDVCCWCGKEWGEEKN